MLEGRELCGERLRAALRHGGGEAERERERERLEVEGPAEVWSRSR